MVRVLRQELERMDRKRALEPFLKHVVELGAQLFNASSAISSWVTAAIPILELSSLAPFETVRNFPSFTPSSVPTPNLAASGASVPPAAALVSPLQPNPLLRHAREVSKSITATATVLAAATAIVIALASSTPLAPTTIPNSVSLSSFAKIAFALLVTVFGAGYVYVSMHGKDLLVYEYIVEEEGMDLYMLEDLGCEGVGVDLGEELAFEAPAMDEVIEPTRIPLNIGDRELRDPHSLPLPQVNPILIPLPDDGDEDLFSPVLFPLPDCDSGKDLFNPIFIPLPDCGGNLDLILPEPDTVEDPPLPLNPLAVAFIPHMSLVSKPTPMVPFNPPTSPTHRPRHLETKPPNAGAAAEIKRNKRNKPGKRERKWAKEMAAKELERRTVMVASLPVASDPGPSSRMPPPSLSPPPLSLAPLLPQIVFPIPLDDTNRDLLPGRAIGRQLDTKREVKATRRPRSLSLEWEAKSPDIGFGVFERDFAEGVDGVMVAESKSPR
ncbi:hypothetical protein DXG03_001764 [Asterophora parasitica]|uniref:Uncharacterized protein n=1 Tax=Asterophora parasitica TaxID=117018 RepID=A0A9P7G4P0_9AGAR|nr:hypothetical protein DXG03_001764 [Asterophora parasitica]